MLNRSTRVVAVLIVAGLAGARAWADDQADARKAMQSTIDKTLAILKNPDLKGEAKRSDRRAQLQSTLLGATDVRRISQLVLGRQRTKFSEEQLHAFSDVFGQLVFVTYTANLEKYTDEKVSIVSVEMQPESKAYVTTKIVSKDKEIPADFSLFKDEHGVWKCYDVKVEGVSMVNNYRSQFSDMLLRKTPEQVIADLKEKVKQNEKTS